jgi:GLPGLI family protein
MRSLLFKTAALATIFLLITSVSIRKNVQEFQGVAYYFSKSSLNLGDWGARLSQAQKKQVAARLKNRLEKSYVLTFNKEESIFIEEEKLDAISGATDSWGKNFSAGDQYKNVKIDAQLQEQEFYGKKFLVKDQLQPIEWTLESESKQIGSYTCFKAISFVPTADLTWYSFSWDQIRNQNSDGNEPDKEESVDVTKIEAWYTPQIPVRHGPSEYWGLPGLILEVSAGDTTMLCSKIVINPDNKSSIEAPSKGTIVSKDEYHEIIINKMKEFRNNRMRRR